MNREPSPSPSPIPPPEVQAAPVDAEVRELTERLEAAHKRVNELAHALQASDRDREEFKRRLTRERERMLEVERGQVALALLEAVDQLDLCLGAADDSALAQGVRLIRESILKQAQASGIERVELVGRPFDPHFAEATDMELTLEPAEEGQVVAVLKACYQLQGRVIRPGTVKVAKYVKPAQA